MMRTIQLSLSLGGPQTIDIANAVKALGWLPQGELFGLEVDYKRAKPTENWFARLSAAEQLFVTVRKAGALEYHRGEMVRLVRHEIEMSVNKLVEGLATIPFEVASVGSIYDAWDDGSLGELERFGFGDTHYSLGWACAFRGAGYRRLVSRRWLEAGPWTLVRRGDLSVVFFHSIEADARNAFASARPGHEQMGISDLGGYLQTSYSFRGEVKGVYEANSRTLKVVVHGREVSPLELRDMAVARRDQVLGPDKPIDTVSYVFLEEDNGRKHLENLWRREFECWTIVAGRELRLVPSE